MAGAVAEYLLNWRNADLIDGVINRLLLHANLKRHAVIDDTLVA